MFNNISFLPTRETLQSFFTTNFSTNRQNIFNLAVKGIGITVGFYLTYKLLTSRYCQPRVVPVKNSIHDSVVNVFGFTEEKEEINRTSSDYKEEIEMINDEKTKITQANKALTAENEGYKRKIARLEKELQSALETIKSQSSGIKQLQELNEIYQKQSDKAVSDYLKLDEENKNLKRTIEKQTGK
ncbi:MAG: hypothetical protein L0207_03475 [Chlamydiae bacterium]|nr:hypothetical protein [Chlamydiota bacterium]